MKKALIPVGLGAIVLAVALFLLWPRLAQDEVAIPPAALSTQTSAPDAPASSENEAEDSYRRAFFYATDVLLPEGVARDCARIQAEQPSEDVLLQRAEGGDVLYLAKERTLHICKNGKALAAAWPTTPVDDEMPMGYDILAEPFGATLGPSRSAFLVFAGRCHEGPCIGDWHLMTTDGLRVREKGRLEADIVNTIDEGGRKALALERVCYDHHFTMGFSILTVAEFSDEGPPRIVPFQEVPTRYPQTFADYEARMLPAESDLSPELFKTRELVLSAYKGTSAPELIASYRMTVATLEGQSLPVHCDPALILGWIAGL